MDPNCFYGFCFGMIFYRCCCQKATDGKKKTSINDRSIPRSQRKDTSSMSHNAMQSNHRKIKQQRFVHTDDRTVDIPSDNESETSSLIVNIGDRGRR